MLIGSRKLAALWGIVVLLLSGFCCYKIINGVNFDTSILSLLPADQQDPIAEKVISEVSTKISKKQVLLFHHGDFELTKAAADTFCTNLKSLDVKNDLAKISCRIDPNEIEQIKQLFFNHRFHLLADSFEKKIVSTDSESLITSTLKDIYAPFTPRIGSIMEDPFNHSMELVQQLGAGSNTYIKDGFVTAEHNGKEWILVFIETAGNPFSISTQQPVSVLLEQAMVATYKQSNSVSDELKIVKYGLLFHAIHGSNTARGEISTIGIGSVLLIGIALLIVFRRPIKILYAFIPTMVGCVFAFSLSILVFERINLITMVFGASLVGVSIDYALHFLCEFNANTNVNTGFGGRQAIKKILSGLVLGLVSSCIAYGALALAPFPGIRQMALFAVTGLIGSWLTVVCWFSMLQPYYKKAKKRNSDMSTDKPTVSDWIYSRVLQINQSSTKALPFLVVIVSVLAVIGWLNLKTNDSISVLNNPSIELKQSEELMRNLLSPPSSTQFIIVSAEDEQSLLQKEEMVTALLGEMITSNVIKGYNAVSSIVPSESTQKQSYDLYGEKVYSKQGALPQLFSKLGLPQQNIDTVMQTYTERQGGFLTIDEWMKTPAAQTLGYQWIGKTEFGYLSVITLTGIDTHALQNAFQDKIEGVKYVDKVAGISNILSEFRKIITTMLIAAYVTVFLLLALRYKTKAVFILMAPLLASVSTVALLSLVGIEINIFCILALLLVLGIGMDYGIFLKESRCSKESVSAVLLSCYTTICSFGFLSMSNTPVLKFFGLTLLIGILLVWVFTILLYRYQVNDMEIL